MGSVSLSLKGCPLPSETKRLKHEAFCYGNYENFFQKKKLCFVALPRMCRLKSQKEHMEHCWGVSGEGWLSDSSEKWGTAFSFIQVPCPELILQKVAFVRTVSETHSPSQDQS
jgi:hypothetical protein